MAMKLAIDEYGYGYKIGWRDTCDGEFGLMLGDGPIDGDDCIDLDHNVAEAVAEKFGYDTRQFITAGAFVWSTKSDATKVLRAAKAAITHRIEQAAQTMPDWAIKATAAGWTPPVGWKP